MKLLFARARDPMSSFTHFIGAILSVVATVALGIVSFTAPDLSARTVWGAIVFGLSLVALYAASAAYHYAKASDAALLRLRKLDHAMIFVLIAGTYTPLFLAFATQDALRLIGIIWSIAGLGILLKMIWMEMPRWLSTLFYIGMGWAIMLDPGLLRSLPTGCGVLLLAGGMAYTGGAVIYAIKKPNIWKSFGFHELFHIFVLLGSTCHFFAVILYAL